MFYKRFEKIDENNEYSYVFIALSRVDDNILKIMEFIFTKNGWTEKSSIDDDMIEYGPKDDFDSPWCSNAITILEQSDINIINKIERRKRIKKCLWKDNLLDPLTEQII